VAAEQITEQVAEHLEDAAGQLEVAAAATRRIDTKAIGFFFGGFGIGLAIGFFFGHRWNKAQLKAEAFAKSEEEVQKIREVYRQRMVAAEPKPSAEDVVVERGYSVREVPDRSLRPPVPVQEPLTREDIVKSKDDGWDFAKELALRSGDRPYIIHQDEYQQSETGYKQVVYTWYDRDNVLTDEDEDPLANPDEIVGMENLSRFGHGADDVRALFVRNPKLETEFEICYVDASYEEAVLGLSNEQTD
jgi:hypothetical protein